MTRYSRAPAGAQRHRNDTARATAAGAEQPVAETTQGWRASASVPEVMLWGLLVLTTAIGIGVLVAYGVVGPHMSSTVVLILFCWLAVICVLVGVIQVLALRKKVH